MLALPPLGVLTMHSALAPTPRDPILRDGTAHLYRFRPNEGKERRVGGESLPLLLVPSLINRWYILDLREGFSLSRAMVDAGLDTWCLDWGVPEDEDRFLSWDDVVARLARAIRAVRRETGAERVGLLGYCMGGTLAAIQTALDPDSIAALVNLAGPVDFSRGGALTHQTDPRWFDAQSIADAGNVAPHMMQSGFVALRPTLQISKWVSYLDRAHDPAFRAGFDALEAWSSDNISFPGAAYATYVGDLYQKNALVKGEHRVAGRRVDLGAIDCPLLTVVTDKDTICPANAASALNEHASSDDAEVFVVPGGHVGAVVGNKAATILYPKLASWLTSRLAA